MKKILLILLIAFNLYAGNVVVATDGSDAHTYATVSGDTTTHWLTILKAAQNIVAGDTCFVYAGTYNTVGSDSRLLPALNPTNSGTSGNLIVFKAVGTVTLTTSTYTGPVIGASGVDYIEWNGFTIDEANASSHADTGPAVLWDTYGSNIKYCTIDGNGDPELGDNHPGIRLESADSCTVSNNTIHDVYTSGVNGVNGAGVQFYESDDAIIEYNEIYNTGSGVFIKGPSTIRSMRATVRYNVIYNTTSGGLVLGGSEDGKLYQNLVYDCVNGVMLWELAAAATPINNLIVNNTFHNSTANGVFLKYYVNANTIKNNIFTTSVYDYYSEALAAPSPLVSDYNNYDTYTNFVQLTGGNQTLASWQSSYSLDTYSLELTTPFVNASVDSFQLTALDSTMYFGIDILQLSGGLATDTVMVGAYITGLEVFGASGVPEASVPPTISASILDAVITILGGQ